MTGFRVKSITAAPSLGEELVRARTALGLAIDQVAESIQISVKYLLALEQGAYHQLPGDVYARNFLKKYADFLKLDSQQLLHHYRKERKIFHKTNGQTIDHNIEKPVAKVSSLGLLVTPKLIRHAVIAVLAVACVAYLGFKVQAIFAPPALMVNVPASDLVTEEKIITIAGQSDQEAVIKINGQQVLADQQGSFNESLALQPGTNIIEITAQKKHSKLATVYRKVVVIEEGS